MSLWKYTLVSMCLVLVGCATTASIKSSSAYIGSLGKLDNSVSAMHLKDQIGSSILHRNGDFYTYKTTGMQRRPYLKNIVTGKVVRGTEASKARSSLSGTNRGFSNTAKMKGVCEDIPQFCYFDSARGQIYVYSENGKLIEVVKLSEDALTSGTAMRGILGEVEFVLEANKQLLIAVKGKDEGREKMLAEQLGSDVDRETIYNLTTVERYKPVSDTAVVARAGNKKSSDDTEEYTVAALDDYLFSQPPSLEKIQRLKSSMKKYGGRELVSKEIVQRFWGSNGDPGRKITLLLSSLKDDLDIDVLHEAYLNKKLRSIKSGNKLIDQYGRLREYSDYQRTGSNIRLTDGTKYIAGLLWQDQPDNEKLLEMTYRQAEQYCSKMDLHGVTSWNLPFPQDVEELNAYSRKNGTKFTYWDKRVKYPARRYLSCSKKPCGVYFAAHLSGDTVVGNADKSTGGARCVTTVRAYEQAQKSVVAKYGNPQTFDEAIDAFAKTGDLSFVQAAAALADDDRKRGRLEFEVAKNLGWNSVFSQVVNTKFDNSGDSGFKVGGTLASLIGKIGDLKFNYEIEPNGLKGFALEYNDYQAVLDVRVTIEVTTGNVMIQTKDIKSFSQQIPVELLAAKEWSVSGEAGLGSALQASRASFLGFDINGKITDIDTVVSLKNVTLK